MSRTAATAKPDWKRRCRNAFLALQGKRSSDFKAAETNRLLLDWIGAGNKSPDQELRGAIRRMRARARELARNEGHCKHYLRLLVVNVLGSGVKLQARVRTPAGKLDRATNAAIETAWRAWAEAPVTVDGRHNLRQLQALLLKTAATDGETYVRFWRGPDRNPAGLALQVLDADLVDEAQNREAGYAGPEIRLGIEVDPVGKPLAYWFYKDYDRWGLGLGGMSNQERVPAEDVIHLYRVERPNQTRGVSWFHPVMVLLHQLAGYTEAELVAARIAAAKMGFIETPEGSAGNDLVPAEMEATPGSIEQLSGGHKFVEWNPDHPTTAFAAFVKALLRQIASALGVGYNHLANDLEGVNYSSLRAGKLVDVDVWRTVQQDHVDDFLRPLFREWVNTALLSGFLKLPSYDVERYAGSVTWGARGWDWVDPLKDINAAEAEIRLGVNSRTRICAERGNDLEELFEELANEEELAREKGLDVRGLGGAKTPAEDDAAEKPAKKDDDDEAGIEGRSPRLIPVSR